MTHHLAVDIGHVVAMALVRACIHTYILTYTYDVAYILMRTEARVCNSTLDACNLNQVCNKKADRHDRRPLIVGGAVGR